MGDLAAQTELEDLGGGRYRGTPSADWEIWGPMGGYIASFALRAAGRTTPHAHPAAFSCHYLGVARFEPIDIVVEARKEGRAAASHRVEITQDGKPIHFETPWPPDGPRPAQWQEWLRFLPTATFEDEWVDACRSVILVDLPSWPSAHRPHAYKQEGWVAPTLDLNVAFHRPSVGVEWLLCDGRAPVSTGGLFGWTAGVWSPDRQLLASGGGQCLYRPPRP